MRCHPCTAETDAHVARDRDTIASAGAQPSFHWKPHLLFSHLKNKVAGSSAERVCISLRYAFMWPHTEHLISVVAPHAMSSRMSSTFFCCGLMRLLMVVVTWMWYAQVVQKRRLTVLYCMDPSINKMLPHVGQNCILHCS